VNRVSSQIEPFDGFPWDWKPKEAESLPPELQGCGRNITPACVKALYQIPDACRATPGNSLGLYEQGDYFNEHDIDSFYAAYASYVPQGTYPIPALIDGAVYSVPIDSPSNEGEADIDIDMASVGNVHPRHNGLLTLSRYSLIYPQNVTLYQTDDQLYEPVEVATTNLFNTFLDALDGVCLHHVYN
jgi:tripeptidyl-peptidase I